MQHDGRGILFCGGMCLGGIRIAHRSTAADGVQPPRFLSGNIWEREFVRAGRVTAVCFCVLSQSNIIVIYINMYIYM